MGKKNQQKKKRKLKTVSLLILTLIVNLCSFQNVESIHAEEVWNIALKEGKSIFVNQMLDEDMFTFFMGNQVMENREQISMSPTVFTEPGLKEIQFKYCNEKQEIYIKKLQVDVQEIKEVSITIQQEEIELIEKQEITKEMLPIVEVNYNNGETKELKDYEYTVDWVNQQIKIKYQDLETMVKMKVLPNAIEYIQVQCDLNQVEQDYILEKKDLLVQAVYSNGEKNEVTEYQILPYKLVAGEESIISIVYKGKTGSFKLLAKKKEESKESESKPEESPEPKSSKEPESEAEESLEPESNKESESEAEESPEPESSKESESEAEESLEPESSKEPESEAEESLEPESSKEPESEPEVSLDTENSKEQIEITEESTEIKGKTEEVENNSEMTTKPEDLQVEESGEKTENFIQKETEQINPSQADNQKSENITVQSSETDTSKEIVTASKKSLQINGDLQFVSLEEADLDIVYLNKNAELSFSELENVNYQIVEQKNSLTKQWISLKDGICFDENNESSILYIQYKDDAGGKHILKSNPFIVDKKKPVISLKNKTYKKNIKIEANDAVGICDMELQGTINKKIENGYKLKKEGEYRLVITDYAGNQKIVQFKLQKPAKKIKLSFSLEKKWNKMKYKAKVINTSRKVTWSTSNKNIASINTEGLLTAKKSGTVYVKAKIDKICVTQKIVISTKTKSILVY